MKSGQHVIFYHILVWIILTLFDAFVCEFYDKKPYKSW